jgi:hypothetical protein
LMENGIVGKANPDFLSKIWNIIRGVFNLNHLPPIWDSYKVLELPNSQIIKSWEKIIYKWKEYEFKAIFDAWSPILGWAREDHIVVWVNKYSLELIDKNWKEKKITISNLDQLNWIKKAPWNFQQWEKVKINHPNRWILEWQITEINWNEATVIYDVEWQTRKKVVNINTLEKLDNTKKIDKTVLEKIERNNKIIANFIDDLKGKEQKITINWEEYTYYKTNEWENLFIAENWNAHKMFVDEKWEILVVNEKIWVSKSAKEFNKIKELSTEELLTQEINNAKSIDEIFTILWKEEKIWKYNSDDVLYNIELYLNWERELTTITSKLNLRNKVVELKKIEIIRKNDELIKKSKLNQLWPKWLNAKTEQWEVWNCYFVAALNTLKHHPNWGELLTNMIKIKSEWVWEVTFKWHNKPIVITSDNLREMKHIWEDWNIQHSYIDTPNLWDIILERAHARITNEQRWWKTDQTFMLNKKWELTHEWWHSDEALRLFLWENIETNRITEWFSKILEKWFDEFDFIWLYSPLIKTDSKKFYVKWVNWENYGLSYRHAYSIKSINNETNIVEVVNPHDSSIIMQFRTEDIENNFWHMYYWRNI